MNYALQLEEGKGENQANEIAFYNNNKQNCKTRLTSHTEERQLFKYSGTESPHCRYYSKHQVHSTI